MKNPDIIEKLTEPFSHLWGNFWRRLYERKQNGRPLIKICGITQEKDAVFAIQMGADILGFIFADSPRRAPIELTRKFHETEILKVGVVVKAGTHSTLDPEISVLLDEGSLDAIQFHGTESPDACSQMAFPYYKALRIKDKKDIVTINSFRCPRVLVDAYVHGIPGGTGKRIAERLVHEIKENYPLWIAGGIGPHNVREIMSKFQPELIDTSSCLEGAPGKKDLKKVKNFFREIDIGVL
jgi:indole-3-glycerol phosphate synthase/phosphoribosylanthranilate isomerase